MGMMELKVNRRLLPGKIAFFGMMSSALLTYPFMILFFKKLGLTNTECAIIYGSLPIFNGFYRLFIEAVTDKLQKHREMTLVFSLISALLMSCLLLVPPAEEKINPEPEWNKTLHYACKKIGLRTTKPVECIVHHASNLHPVQDISGIDSAEWFKIKHHELNNHSVCSERVNGLLVVDPNGCDALTMENENATYSLKGSEYLCRLDCTNYPEELLSPPEPQKEMYGKTFWMIFCLYFVAFNLQGSLWVLLYGMIYAILGEKRNNFGKTRVWGTIGAITTAIISAIAMNKYGSVTNEISFIPCFIGFDIWICITGVAAMFFKLPHIPRNPTMTRDILTLMKQPAIFLLFVILSIMGFLWGAVDTFLFVFLRTLNASSFTLGTCMFVRYLGEIPALYFSGRVIKRIGHIKCLYIILFAYSIRYLGTSMISNPWFELPFSCLENVVFCIGFTAVSVYGSLITPPSMHATLQAMIQTAHFGIGRGIGILVVGPVIDSVGYRWTFRIGSIIALTTFFFYIIVQRFMPPVKFVKHDEVGDVEVKEPLQEENREIKKSLEEEEMKKPIEPQFLDKKLIEDIDDQPLKQNGETMEHV